jgi:hypothetical protein
MTYSTNLHKLRKKIISGTENIIFLWFKYLFDGLIILKVQFIINFKINQFGLLTYVN